MNRRPSQFGFTLIEILIVITILAVLVGISIPVAMKMGDESDVRVDRSMLTGLSGAIDNYELRTGSMPDHTDKSIATVSDDDLQDTTIGVFLVRAYQLGENSETWRMITSATKSKLVIPDVRTPPYTAYNWYVLDNWDHRIRYVKAVSHDDAFKDDDFLPANPTPYFASAGPDGLWGDAREVVKKQKGKTYDADLVAQTEDNIYSFDMD